MNVGLQQTIPRSVHWIRFTTYSISNFSHWLTHVPT